MGALKLTLTEKREVVTGLLGKSTREGLRVLAERSPEIMTPSEKLSPLPDHKTLVQFVASHELMEKLEELKHLLAHKNFEGRMDALVDQIADIALSQLKPKAAPDPIATPAPGKTQTIKKPEISGSDQTSVGNKKRSRYIPLLEKRRVLLRDQNGCTYQDPKTGRVCQSKRGLQYEHIQPFSLGGQNSAENLTLLCGAHNRYRAQQMGLWN